MSSPDAISVESPESESSAPRPRRWIRFRLVTLMLIVLLFSIWFAFQTYREPIGESNLRLLRPVSSMEGKAWEIVFSPDRRSLALLGWETPVTIYDSQSLYPLRTVCQGRKAIHFAFSSDPNIYAFAENDTFVEIVNAKTEKSLRIDALNPQPKMDFSPDGRLLVTGGYGDAAYVWDATNGKQIHRLGVGGIGGGLTPVFSPDGSKIAIGNRNYTTRVWDTETGVLLHEFNKAWSHGIAFHPDEDVLAVSYVNGSFALWDLTTGNLLHHEQTDADELYQIEWSRDGEFLITCGLNADIAIWQWDGAKVKHLHSLEAPEWVVGATFSPDGTRIITAGGEQAPNTKRTVQVWAVPLSQRLLGD